MVMENGSSSAVAVSSGGTSRSIGATTSDSSTSITASSKAANAASNGNESHHNTQTGSNGGPIACNGCHLSLEETSDTVVVSFGDGLWHVDW